MSSVPALAEGVTEAMARSNSLLNYYREILAAKNRHPEIARGTPEAISSSERALAIYEVVWNEGRVIIAHNLSTESLTVEVNLGQRISITERLNPNDINGGGFNWDGTSLTVPARSTAILR
jgi:glycosidase